MAFGICASACSVIPRRLCGGDRPQGSVKVDQWCIRKRAEAHKKFPGYPIDAFGGGVNQPKKGEIIWSSRESKGDDDMKRLTGRGPSSSQSSSGPSSSPVPEHEPSTQSEVQTKLDLARQYIDMGDPESARHMLSEVLEEGDPAQKQEAQRLMDSLP